MDTPGGILTGPPKLTPFDQMLVFTTIGGFRRGVLGEIWLKNSVFTWGSPPEKCLSDIKIAKTRKKTRKRLKIALTFSPAMSFLETV